MHYHYMPQARRTQQAAVFNTLAKEIYRLNPIAYYPLWETGGTDIYDISGNSRDGTASSDVSGWPVGAGCGDGRTAPQFDGTNDYIELPAAFRTAFDVDEHSIAVITKLPSASWTDGTLRRVTAFFANSNNASYIFKSNANNRLVFQEIWGGTGSLYNLNGMTDTDWMFLAMTRSLANNRARAFYNGEQVGTAWNTPDAGVAITQAYIGASSTVPNFPLSGSCANCVVWNRELTAEEIRQIYDVWQGQ